MKPKNINRRDFVKSSAVAASATIMAACSRTINIQTADDETAELPAEVVRSATENQGESMKILIVYDTLYGNTEKIASAIKDGFGPQHEVSLSKAAQIDSTGVKNINLLLVGSPTHGGQYTEDIKAFFNAIPENGLNHKMAAAFDTGTNKENENGFVKFIINFFGYASPRIAKALTEKGASMVGAETFLVKGKEGPLSAGEMERAKTWANEIIKKANG